MSIEQRIMEIVQENNEKKAAITMHTDLKEEAGFDSFGYLMILNALEEEFSIHIDETQFRHLRTISHIVDEMQRQYPGLERKQ
jgi:acyl carrier protein